MVRKILGVIIGLIVGSIANMGIIQISSAIYGAPAAEDPVALETYLAELPVGGYLLVLAAHTSQAFLGAIVCVVIAGRPWYLGAIIVAVFTMLGGATLAYLWPAPMWFEIVDLLLYIPAGLAGGAVGAWLRPGKPEDAAAEPSAASSGPTVRSE